MRSDRFISIATVIALLSTVQVAMVAADDALPHTVTFTRTVYNKPTGMPIATDKEHIDTKTRISASVSDIKKSRGEQHTIINQPETVTHYITEIHHPTPSHVVSSAKPMPISSASPVVIVSASPTAVMPTSQVNNGEEVIIVTKTKKNKTKLKTKTRKNSSAIQSVTQSAPMSAIHTASVVPISQRPSSSVPSLVSKSMVPSSSVTPSASGSTPMGTSSLMSGSIPPAAASSVDAVPGVISMSSASPSASPMATVMVVAAPSQAPPPSAAAPATKQSPSIDSVNNGNNKKINPPAASANPANGAQSHRSVGPALFLAWLMAAAAAF